MSLFLFFALFILVLVIYLIFFKMMYLSYEKIHSQHDVYQARHLLSIQEEQYRHCASIESSRRMNHTSGTTWSLYRAFCRAGVFRVPATIWSSIWIPHGRSSSLRNCAATRWSTRWWGYYRALALQKGIRFQVRIQVPDELSVSDIDLSVILGNLLENAIDAADRGEQDERFIQFHILCSGQMLAITVDNGFQGEIKKADGRYVSSKPNHSGLGLRSIEMIADKYEGGVEFTHDPHVFHSSVMLAL